MGSTKRDYLGCVFLPSFNFPCDSLLFLGFSGDSSSSFAVSAMKSFRY